MYFEDVIFVRENDLKPDRLVCKFTLEAKIRGIVSKEITMCIKKDLIDNYGTLNIRTWVLNYLIQNNIAKQQQDQLPKSL